MIKEELKNKILYTDAVFTKSQDPADEAIYIEGYASTNDVDRAEDVVSSKVWERGLDNYLKNPIILAYHSYAKPVGRMVEHRSDDRGLWIKARISSAAREIYDLVKDGVLTAFSIGFRIIDAEYNSAAEVFLIKEVELHEISVVPVPCNPNTLFSLSKAFDSAADFDSYKLLFAKEATQVKEPEALAATAPINKKEWNMTPEELQAAIEKATAQALEKAELARKEAEQKAQAELAEKQKFDAQIAAAVKTGQSGTEKLLADLEARFNEESTKASKSIEDLGAALKEKAAELQALQTSKMHFADKGQKSAEYPELEKAIFLSKMSGKGLTETRYGRQLVEKIGAHVPSATWELEVSLRMEDEVRRRLVVSPLLRQIEMKTNVMTLPINPEAGFGTWVTNAQFGTSASSGAAQTHALTEITLNSYKLATKEYLAFEEEEDSLLALLPVVRDAMIRRIAKSVDKAFLLGAGAGADPVKGLAIYDATSAVTKAVAQKAAVTDMIALRRDLGAYGLDPSEVTYVVSTDIYYDLLEDTSFQTVDKVSDRATLLTGQIGSIGNSPVLVSAQFPTKASGTTSGTVNIGAIAINTGNFIAGNQRGLRIDTDDLVEDQKKVLVASLRTGLTKLTSNLGDGVSTFRWIP